MVDDITIIVAYLYIEAPPPTKPQLQTVPNEYSETNTQPKRK